MWPEQEAGIRKGCNRLILRQTRYRKDDVCPGAGQGAGNGALPRGYQSAKVFDEAKKGNIILFFDEADAIFSQRTEISGTNDKHANAEVSFLLQKMEEYPGVAILATNLIKNFDPAVMRRLTYSINFELPDKETVLKLWQTILPEHVKIDPKIDLEFFAENLELSGSNIKSILYNAAYMAASEDAEEIVITGAELVPAIQMEYEKIGEFLNRSSLGQYMVYAKV